MKYYLLYDYRGNITNYTLNNKDIYNDYSCKKIIQK